MTARSILIFEQQVQILNIWQLASSASARRVTFGRCALGEESHNIGLTQVTSNTYVDGASLSDEHRTIAYARHRNAKIMAR